MVDREALKLVRHLRYRPELFQHVSAFRCLCIGDSEPNNFIHMYNILKK